MALHRSRASSRSGARIEFRLTGAGHCYYPESGAKTAPFARPGFAAIAAKDEIEPLGYPQVLVSYFG